MPSSGLRIESLERTSFWFDYGLSATSVYRCITLYMALSRKATALAARRVIVKKPIQLSAVMMSITAIMNYDELIVSF